MFLDDPLKRKPNLTTPAKIAPPPVDFNTAYNEAVASGDFSKLVFNNNSGKIKTAKGGARDAEAAAQGAVPSFSNVLKGMPKALKTVTGTFLRKPLETTGDLVQGAMNTTIPYFDREGYQTARSKRDPNAKPSIRDIGRNTLDIAKNIKIGDVGDRLEREAFMSAAEGQIGLSRETSESLYDAYMDKDIGDDRRVFRDTGGILGLIAPYEATASATRLGLQYAAPRFVENHKLMTTILSSGIGSVGAAQAGMGPEATSEERLDPKANAIAFATGPLFEVAAPVLRAAKNLIPRKILPTRWTTGNVEPVIPAEGVAPKDSPIAAVVTPEGDMAIATNNIDAVRNYLRNSGKTNVVIDERQAGRLGMTPDGHPVTARHQFNPKTGMHTITVSSSADAQTIAHEWGHYIDDEIAREIRGLSTYLFGDATRMKNVQGVEDTFRSLAMRELIDEGYTSIPGEMIDNKMTQLISAVRSEVRSLASQRPDPRSLSGSKKQSEKLADAVSVTLTGEGANRRGAFYKFLQEAKVTDSNLVQALRSTKRAEQQLDSAEPTALDRAQTAQRAAVSEKLGMGDKIPERASRPNSKFDQTKSRMEEEKFSNIPKRLTGRTAEQVEGVIKKNKIPSQNLVEINVSGKKPVTLAVHSIDRDIVRAIQVGAKTKYMTMVVRRVMKEFGMSQKGAEAYVAKRFKDIKAFATQQADEQAYVFAKMMRQPKAKDPVSGEILEQRTLPEAEPAPKADGTAETPAPAPKDEYEITADRQDALDEMRMELETAEAGYRTPIGDEQGYTREWIGVKSSFPDWAPEGTRSRKMFDVMLKHLKEGTEPPMRATKQRELWDIIQARIEKYEMRNATANEADTMARQMREEEIMRRETDAATSEYEAEFSRGAKDGPYTRAETPPSEKIGFGEGEGRLRVDLDRMDTGKKPATDPFRAEKMTNDLDEEVFLNTKILPKITGENRISRSNADIMDQAAASKLTEAEALNMLKDRYGALTPDTRKLFEYGMQKTRDIIAKLDGRAVDALTPEELLQFKNDVAQAVQLFEVYTGARTEASNLLRSFGLASQNGEDDVLRGMFEQLQKSGLTSEKDVWRAMAKISDVAKGSTWYDKYYNVLFASWLSGPATTIRNIAGSLGNITTNIASKAFNPKTAMELPETVGNFFRDFVQEGLPAAKQILKGEGTTDSKFLSFDPSFPLPEGAYAKGDKALYLRAAEGVSRWLNAQDIALARTVQAMERRSLRVYKPDISDAVAKAVSDQYGLASVYRGVPKGTAVRALTEAAETLTRKAPVFRAVIPFVRTIGNVMDRQFDYMPLFSTLRMREKFLLPQAREIAKKYGISEEKDIALIMQRLKDQQQGRMYLGMAVTAGAAVLAKQGLISGNGPSNYNERIQLERTGWRRNSIKIGNTWVPYTYIGPLSGILSLAGNINDAIEYENADDKSVSQMLTNGIIGWMATQMNSSFLKGTADLLEVLTRQTPPATYFKNLGASLVPIPAAYSQTLQMGKTAYGMLTDNPALRQQYETKNVVDAIRVKMGVAGVDLPGMPALNPRTDMFGEPMTLDLIYGLTPTVDKRDKMPVDNLLISNGVVVTIPKKNQSFKVRNKDVTMTDAQYSQYVRDSGKAIYDALEKQYGSLKKLKGQELQDRVEDIVRIERARARTRILR